MDTSSKEVLRPAMTLLEINLFTKYVSRCNQYFEYGVGGSTVHASINSSAIIRGVDSSREWISKVNKLTKTSQVNLTYIDIGPIGKWGNPANNKTKHLWPNYSLHINHTDITPDFILVDGRFRVACIIQSILYSIKNNIDPIISLHDCKRSDYNTVNRLLSCVDQVDELSIYKVNFDVVNEDELNDLYEDFKFKPA